jgi:putative NADPH-quinone reductase
MNIMVLLAHPDPASFNHAIADTVCARIKENSHRLIFHDLYQERFDPVLPAAEIPAEAELPSGIDAHCRELADADGIVIIHPNWWGQPPAVLKGWVDRVIRPGVAYRFLDGDAGAGIPLGLLKARSAVVFNTANTPAQRECNIFKDPLELLWRNCIFDLCGVTDFYRRMFAVVVTSTTAERTLWLAEVTAAIDRFYPPT